MPLSIGAVGVAFLVGWSWVDGELLAGCDDDGDGELLAGCDDDGDDGWLLFEATEEEASLLFCDEFEFEDALFEGSFTCLLELEDLLLSFVDDLTLLDDLLTLLLSTVGFVSLVCFWLEVEHAPSNTNEDTVIMESRNLWEILFFISFPLF